MTSSPWRVTPLQVIETPQASILVYHNVYPEGKQGGLELIQHGERVATNGDLRLEPIPGQWAPLPKVTGRSADPAAGWVTVMLRFEEPAIAYNVRTWTDSDSIRIAVDLTSPLPAELAGKAGFNLELLPSACFGKTYSMDGVFNAFPRQANGPIERRADGSLLPSTLARGRHLVIAPEDDLHRLDIESRGGALVLLDGRMAAQNGWFVVRTLVPEGKTENAVEWRLTPNRVPGWTRPPQLLVSQVGYHPDQEKQALIELDPHDTGLQTATLLRVTPQGPQEVLQAEPTRWGPWLHYAYALFDFSAVRDTGMYQLRYGQHISHPFKISAEVYQQDVWQPTLETFMPNQMCHVRVEDIHRVWHGACHLDDALQAPLEHEHFDGYRQYGATETPFEPFTHIPGLDRGGWHDAGDYDLATGSQASTTYNLVLAREAFDLSSDQTTVLPDQRLVLLHTPDGIPDVVQQVRHGVEFILGAYRAAGHSFTGIIEGTIKQYVHLGDAATMTDNRIYDAQLPPNTVTGDRSSERDDRWAFTNQDTALEYQVAATLAAASRVLRGFDDGLAADSLGTALGVWEREHNREPVSQPNAYQPRNPQATEVLAAIELYITTGEERFLDRVVALWETISSAFDYLGWAAARAIYHAGDRPQADDLRQKMLPAVEAYQARLAAQEEASPFRLPFGPGWLNANRPDHDPFDPAYYAPIWGVGWNLQGFALHHYYLLQAFPTILNRESLLRVLNYVLGWHPANNLSLVSGVGAQSLTVAYGTNRAEWSYTPGGVASGPALLRPNLIELMDPFPWLWQQKEYVIGGAASYIFLVLAADRLLNGERTE